MKDFSYIIREIKPEDNLHICNVIRGVFVELKLPLVGTAYQDDETESMYQSYQNSREKYFVIESNGIIFGGGGIKPLENGDDNVCELQKMYFSKLIRGKGVKKNQIILTNETEEITKNDFVKNNEILISVGKKKHFRVVLE